MIDSEKQSNRSLRFSLASIAVLACMTLFNGCEGIGDDDDDDVIHYQGKDCMTCHSSGEYAFNSGGTVFTRLNGADEDINAVAVNHTLRLVLESGLSLTYTKGMGYGNAHWRGDVGAIDSFTAQVLDPNGAVVNSSNPNSHHVGMLACNTCHSATGANGAPGRIINYRPTETTATVSQSDPTFSASVMPILTNKCVSCHSSTSNNGFIVDTADSANAYKEVMYYVTTDNPAGSAILLKPTGSNHMLIFDTNTAEYDTILQWIEAGALNN